jgi:hypothetical protein
MEACGREPWRNKKLTTPTYTGGGTRKTKVEEAVETFLMEPLVRIMHAYHLKILRKGSFEEPPPIQAGTLNASTRTHAPVVAAVFLTL